MYIYTILNVNGMVIGSATANNPQAAVNAWNAANRVSKEYAVEAVRTNS